MASPISTKSAVLRRAAGRVLIAGLEGASLSALEAAWLKLISPGGIILFRRNLESARQIHALLQAAQEVSVPHPGKLTSGLPETLILPPLRLIDVEGGTVDRLRDLIAPMPSAAAVGTTGDPQLFAAHGRLIGKELRMLGFDLTLAPVLDLRTASSANVLSSRAVSSDPFEVIEYAGRFLGGLTGEGILGCGKHFPGLGAGGVDSHVSTPRIQKTLSSVWKEDLLPYRALAAQLPWVMISHASYPRTPSGKEPASISSFWTTTMLRKKIGFRGMIVSDDMEMGGILSYTDMASAAVQAILAGTQRIEICRDPARVLAAYEALLTEAERSPAFLRRLLSAASAALPRGSLKQDRLSPAPTARAVHHMRDAIHRFSEEVNRKGSGQKSLRAGGSQR